ncbi:AAA family ATPase [Patescibacteria group bacterium]
MSITRLASGFFVKIMHYSVATKPFVSPTEKKIARRTLTKTYKKLNRPVIVLVAGLPGSGRNALARYIALKHRLAHLSFENLIHRFLQQGGSPKLLLKRARESAYSVLSQEMSRRHGVVFEGMLLTRDERERLVKNMPADTLLFTVITSTPDKLALHRLQRRNINNYKGHNVKQHATSAEYRRYQNKFQMPSPGEFSYTVVDTSNSDLDGQLTLIDDYFRDYYNKVSE